MEKARIKLSFEIGDIEIEVTEQFVRDQIDNLEYIINILPYCNDEDINDLLEEKVKEEKKLSNVEEEGLVVPNTFGEWFHRFKDDLLERDKALIASYYVQKKSSNNEFNTSEVSKILKEHGNKLSNTSKYLERLIKNKLLFQTRRDGKQKYMRVSADGINYLKSLL